MEPLRREILVGEPETLIVDSTLVEILHPRQVGHFQRLRGEAPFALRYQPGAHLLRAYAGKRSGCLLDRGVVGRETTGSPHLTICGLDALVVVWAYNPVS